MILLDFWGSWCAPCRKSIAHLIELQAEAGRQAIPGSRHRMRERLDVSRIAGRARRRRCEDLGITYPVLLSTMDGPCPVQQALQIQFYPTMILIDREGRLLAREQGATDTTLPRMDRAIDSAFRHRAGGWRGWSRFPLGSHRQESTRRVPLASCRSFRLTVVVLVLPPGRSTGRSTPRRPVSIARSRGPAASRERRQDDKPEQRPAGNDQIGDQGQESDQGDGQGIAEIHRPGEITRVAAVEVESAIRAVFVHHEEGAETATAPAPRAALAEDSARARAARLVAPLASPNQLSWRAHRSAVVSVSSIDRARSRPRATRRRGSGAGRSSVPRRETRRSGWALPGAGAR